jgi:hypothetical protein
VERPDQLETQVHSVAKEALVGLVLLVLMEQPVLWVQPETLAMLV